MGSNIIMGFAQVLDMLCKMAQVVIVASVVTVISWFFIEKPFLNLKNRRYANVKANN